MIDRKKAYDDDGIDETPEMPVFTVVVEAEFVRITETSCEGKQESRPIVTRLSLGCLILVRSLL